MRKDSMSLPKLSRRQRALSSLCKKLAGSDSEESATNLLPEHMRIKGMRLRLYRLVSRLRYAEGNRLVAKYGTHQFASE